MAPPESARRPVALQVVGGLFVAVGIGGIAAHGWTFLHATGPGEAADFAWAGESGALALTGGALLLLGRDGARWLLAAWMAAHLVLGAMHDAETLAIHAVLFAPIAWILFRRPAPPRGSPSPPSSGAPSPPG